jgi:Na+-transporting NADH:ubiquinone oxidoreductase subunit B
MKNFFDGFRKHFEGDGKLKSFYPLFEATESFFYIPGIITKKCPHVRDNIDLKRFMSIVIIAILPAFFWGIYNAGYQSLASAGGHPGIFDAVIKGIFIVLPIVVVSYAAGFFWEILFASIRRHPISEGFLVTGLLFPLTLPPSIPLWQVAVGISFGVVMGKEVFGGTGRNFLNPALTGRAFLFFSYPVSMSGDAIWTKAGDLVEKTVDAVSGATPLSMVSQCNPGANIVEALSEGGYTFSKLFYGLFPGSIGETSALMCLIGAIILIATGVANYRIILSGILGVLVTGFFLNIFSTTSASVWFGLNPFYHLIMGGFAFGIVYMATDPVSAPGMNASRWIYGFLIGMLTIIIRVFNPAYPEGVMLSILFMNLAAPMIDHFVIEFKLKSRLPNV